MKIIFYSSIILLFLSCSNIQNEIKNPPFVNLVVQQDKYSLILNHEFYKNFKTHDRNLAKINVQINLSFNESKTLSRNGNNDLTIINGNVIFKIYNTQNNKIIKSGNISSSISTGSVSSLYGIDENKNFVKERLSKYLANKLYRKILLNIPHSEN